MLLYFSTTDVFRQIPANVYIVGFDAFIDSLRIIYIFITNKQQRRKSIDYIMLHDRVHIRPNRLYIISCFMIEFI